jgi:hypothetical protein
MNGKHGQLGGEWGNSCPLGVQTGPKTRIGGTISGGVKFGQITIFIMRIKKISVSCMYLGGKCVRWCDKVTERRQAASPLVHQQTTFPLTYIQLTIFVVNPIINIAIHPNFNVPGIIHDNIMIKNMRTGRPIKKGTRLYLKK